MSIWDIWVFEINEYEIYVNVNLYLLKYPTVVKDVSGAWRGARPISTGLRARPELRPLGEDTVAPAWPVAELARGGRLSKTLLVTSPWMTKENKMRTCWPRFTRFHQSPSSGVTVLESHPVCSRDLNFLPPSCVNVTMCKCHYVWKWLCVNVTMCEYD